MRGMDGQRRRLLPAGGPLPVGYYSGRSNIFGHFPAFQIWCPFQFRTFQTPSYVPISTLVPNNYHF